MPQISDFGFRVVQYLGQWWRHHPPDENIKNFIHHFVYYTMGYLWAKFQVSISNKSGFMKGGGTKCPQLLWALKSPAWIGLTGHCENFKDVIQIYKFWRLNNPQILNYLGGTYFGRRAVRVKFGGNLFWWLKELKTTLPIDDFFCFDSLNMQENSD